MQLYISASYNPNHFLILNAIKHNGSASVKATNILTCNLSPLRGVVSVRARNGYRPRQVLASVFALLSKIIMYIVGLVHRLSKEIAILGVIIATVGK